MAHNGLSHHRDRTYKKNVHVVPFLSLLWLWHHGLITCTYCMGSKVSSLSRIYLYLQLLCYHWHFHLQSIANDQELWTFNNLIYSCIHRQTNLWFKKAKTSFFSWWVFPDLPHLPVWASHPHQNWFWTPLRVPGIDELVRFKMKNIT